MIESKVLTVNKIQFATFVQLVFFLTQRFLLCCVIYYTKYIIMALLLEEKVFLSYPTQTTCERNILSLLYYTQYENMKM